MTMLLPGLLLLLAIAAAAQPLNLEVRPTRKLRDCRLTTILYVCRRAHSTA